MNELVKPNNLIVSNSGNKYLSVNISFSRTYIYSNNGKLQSSGGILPYALAGVGMLLMYGIANVSLDNVSQLVRLLK